MCVENHIGACVAAQIGDHGSDQVDGIQSEFVRMCALKTTVALVWRHKLLFMTAIKSMDFSQELCQCMR